MVEFYNEDELQQSAFARVILTGDRGVGKTVAVLRSSPLPICVINCDGPGAPMAAKRHGAKGLMIADITCAQEWKEACKSAVKMAAEGKVKTIVVDTVTLLINNIIGVEMGKKFDGFDIWRETLQNFLDGYNLLWKAQAHVFIIAHYDMADGQLTLDGKLKKDLPALAHDIVHLDYKPGRDPQRAFHLGPSAMGMTKSREIDENKVIPADVKVLLAELGLEE